MRMKVEEIDQIVDGFVKAGNLTRAEIEYIYSVGYKSNFDLLVVHAGSYSNFSTMDYDSHDYVFNLVVFKVAHAELMARLE